MKKSNTNKRSKTTSTTINKVVGIGASAGGLEAIQQLFTNIPDDTGNTFVIIQHLSPEHKSLMPELLSKHTKMPIYNAQDKQSLKPNCIYLNQGETNLQLKEGKIALVKRNHIDDFNFPIDVFFNSLGKESNENAIGIILSGTGSDGSRGINTIKKTGGLVYVQLPETAVFKSMPQASIDTGLVDFILKPEKIGNALLDHSRVALNSSKNKKSNAIFSQILIEIEKFSGVDFKSYKKATLLRRLEKRFNIKNLGSLDEYLALIKSNDSEKEKVFYDLLIGVTSFFRDYPAYEVLSKQVFPKLCLEKDISNPIRIWVPGCSTGQEVYSIAMYLDHYLTMTNQEIEYKVFASDIHEQSLLNAGRGLFPKEAIAELDNTFLDKYFVRKRDQIEIKKRIRDRILFSTNDVLKDPPFIRMDLISCRNLLIYLDAEAQNRVISNFLFSLNKDGYLFLGSSENLGKYNKEFEIISTKWKVFKTLHANTRNFNGDARMGIHSRTDNHHSRQLSYKDQSEVPFYKFISEAYGPSLIFIDQDFNIKFIKGEAGKFLQPKEGVFTKNLMEMADPSVATILRNGIASVASKKTSVIAENVEIPIEEKHQVVNLTFKKIVDDRMEAAFLIEIEHQKMVTTPIKKLKTLPANDIATQRIAELENELKAKKEELRNLVEELETSNEELQSTNEELMASNEELQSTNEEFQSVNEELHSVNSELQQKNEEVQTLYADLSNLYTSQDVASIFLDEDLCIRYFTPSISNSLDLKDSDIGRPLANFMFFDQKTREQLLSQAAACLKSGEQFENPFTENERINLMRIHPFTKNEGIVGVVITIIDVDELVKTQNELELSRNQYEKLFKNLNVGFCVNELVFDKKGKPVNLIQRKVNSAFEKILNFKAKEVLDQPLEIFGFDKDMISKFVNLASKVEKSGKPDSLQFWFESFQKHLQIAVFPSGEKNNVGWVFYDITEIVESEKAVALEKEKYAKLFHNSNVGKAVTEIVYDKKNKPVNLINRLVNKEYEKILGVKAENILNETLEAIDLGPETIKNYVEKAVRVESTGQTESFEDWFEQFNKHLRVQVFSYGEKNKIGWVFQDITEQVNANLAIEQANTRMNLANNIGKMAIWEWNIREDRIENYNKSWEDIYEMSPDKASSQFNNFIHEEDQENVYKIFKDYLEAKEESYTQEYRFWSPKLNSFKWIKNVGRVIEWGADHTPLRVIGLSMDVTERKEYEVKILKERAFRESLTETSTCGIYIFDVRLNQNIYINKKGAELLNMSVEEIQTMDSQTFINRFHPDDIDEVIEHINYLVERKKEKPIKYRFEVDKDTYRYFLSTDTPYEIDKDGKLVSYIGSFIDITKQEKTEQELVTAKEEAEQASKQKDLFLSNMSHEIRTPLNGVIGFSKLLRKDNLSPKKRETYLEQIESNSQQLMTIINDVLNLSKIDSGSFELNMENINFHQTLQSIVDGHTVQLKEMENKGDLRIALANKLPKRPIGIKTDEVRLSQVINNLITNAIKYSKKGTIEVGYKVKKKTIDIWVKDEGLGIKKDQLELIFQRFSQVHEKLSRQTGGIGLGLAISKAIADVLGGSISVESTYRQGSTFTLTIPYEPVEAPHSRIKNNRKVKKVIVGDDSPSVQFYFKSLLEEYDIELLQAFDGSEVVNLLKANEDVDLVFMDMRMPKMDGPTALQNLRKFNQKVKVVGQSAFAIEEQVEKFKSYGFDEYITKPIDEDKLKQLINH